MRWFVGYLLAAICFSTGAFADDAAFQRKVAYYLLSHRMGYPKELLAGHGETSLDVTFSIDRDGKLLDAKVTRESGSKKADEEALEWIKRMQPYPRVPADLQSPFSFSMEIHFDAPSAASSLFDDKKIKRAINSICRGC